MREKCVRVTNNPNRSEDNERNGIVLFVEGSFNAR